MRDAGRLLETTVLARAGARALVGVGLGLLASSPVVAFFLALALGATSIVERVAVLQVRDREGSPWTAAAWASAGVAILLGLTLLQLQLLVSGPGALRPGGHVEAAQRIVERLATLDLHGWLLLGLSLVGAAVALGALSGALAVADLRDSGSDASASLIRWFGGASALLGLCVGLGLLASGPASAGRADLALVAALCGAGTVAAAFVGLHLVVAALFLLDVTADTLVRIDWSFAP